MAGEQTLRPTETRQGDWDGWPQASGRGSEPRNRLAAVREVTRRKHFGPPARARCSPIVNGSRSRNPAGPRPPSLAPAPPMPPALACRTACPRWTFTPWPESTSLACRIGSNSGSLNVGRFRARCLLSAPRPEPRNDRSLRAALRERSALQSDMVLHHPGGLSVVIETEFEPARTVERDALQRLGRVTDERAAAVEQVVAVRIRADLREGQGALASRFERAESPICALSGPWRRCRLQAGFGRASTGSRPASSTSPCRSDESPKACACRKAGVRGATSTLRAEVAFGMGVAAGRPARILRQQDRDANRAHGAGDHRQRAGLGPADRPLLLHQDAQRVPSERGIDAAA